MLREREHYEPMMSDKTAGHSEDRAGHSEDRAVFEEYSREWTVSGIVIADVGDVGSPTEIVVRGFSTSNSS